MSQLRGLGPLPLMLKWIQIQNFVDVVTILESKWPKKWKKNLLDFIWLQNDQKRCQKWAFLMKLLNICDLFLKILKLFKRL